jgi:hypothetical protein
MSTRSVILVASSLITVPLAVAFAIPLNGAGSHDRTDENSSLGARRFIWSSNGTEGIAVTAPFSVVQSDGRTTIKVKLATQLARSWQLSHVNIFRDNGASTGHQKAVKPGLFRNGDLPTDQTIGEWLFVAPARGKYNAVVYLRQHDEGMSSSNACRAITETGAVEVRFDKGLAAQVSR